MYFCTGGLLATLLLTFCFGAFIVLCLLDPAGHKKSPKRTGHTLKAEIKMTR